MKDEYDKDEVDKKKSKNFFVFVYTVFRRNKIVGLIDITMFILVT